jgi:hypothetical protein
MGWLQRCRLVMTGDTYDTAKSERAVLGMLT